MIRVDKRGKVNGIKSAGFKIDAVAPVSTRRDVAPRHNLRTMKTMPKEKNYGDIQLLSILKGPDTSLKKQPRDG